MGGSDAGRRPTAVRFLLIALEVALAFWALDRYHVAEDFGLPRILPLVFAGFVVHAWLPLAWRPAAFLALSLAAAGLVLGWRNAAWLTTVGVGLVGLCHLSLPFAARVLLLLAAGAGLAVERTRLGHSVIPELVLPILGSMFMFRLILYVHHLRHHDAPASWSQRLGYFFLLPNVCFPLFPIIDYDTYRRRYYDADACEIYQKGVHWMARGLVHIVLYRIVYHYFTPSPADVVDLGGVVRFAVSAYLLYLRISGQFHLVIGMLCLFGMNLPRTHNFYFMATSFNDLWRRVNVYWKDFMLKIVYYPLALRLRGLGAAAASVSTIFLVMAVTWMLHSYQWFWLRGHFPLTAIDGIFWGVLALLMAINAMLESGRGASRLLVRESQTIGLVARKSANGVATFAAMCLLWSFLASATPQDWWATMTPIARVSSGTVAALVAMTAGLFTLYFAIHWIAGPVRRDSPPFARSLLETSAISVVLLVLGTQTAQTIVGPTTGNVLSSLDRDRLNDQDIELKERGYYEKVLAMDRYLGTLWTKELQPPADGSSVELRTSPGEESPMPLRPSHRFISKRAVVTTNRWGMRDVEYDKEKAPSTYRIALVGGSESFGAGVDDGRNYESILERKLNHEKPSSSFDRYEILNFSIPGRMLLERERLLDERFFSFEPDAVFVTSAGGDDKKKTVAHLVRRMRKALEAGRPLVFGPREARRMWESAAIEAGMSETEITRRLKPLADDLVKGTYRRLASICRERGAVPVLLLVPMPRMRRGLPDVDEVMRVASEAGMVPLSLDGAYRGETRSQLDVAPWDGHPNARAHHLLAEALYREILAQRGPLGLAD